jgi:Dienelactone hydrolase and related enzymes
MGAGTEKRSVGELADRAVRIRIDGVELDADLRIPHHPRGVVIFAHGSGGGRRSPGSRLVAEELEQSGFATLLVDLLTREEQRHDERTGSLRFDIALLASRLGSVSDWAIHEAKLWSLPVGYYGASTEAAAAIVAAVRRPGVVRAIVSRGGRPDLALNALAKVHCPTLLMVGAEDARILRLNEEALGKLGGRGTLSVVPHATHLFEEPGALERVAILTQHWFDQYLVHRPRPASQEAW